MYFGALALAGSFLCATFPQALAVPASTGGGAHSGGPAGPAHPGTSSDDDVDRVYGFKAVRCEPPENARLKAALEGAGELAASGLKYIDDEIPFGNYFHNNDKPTVKAMLQAIKDFKNIQGLEFTCNEENSLDMPEECEDEDVYAFTEPNTNRIDLCPTFFEGRGVMPKVTAQAYDPVKDEFIPYFKPSAATEKWCAKGEDKKRENRAFTLLHELTHTEFVGKKANLKCPKNVDGDFTEAHKSHRRLTRAENVAWGTGDMVDPNTRQQCLALRRASGALGAETATCKCNAESYTTYTSDTLEKDICRPLTGNTQGPPGGPSGGGKGKGPAGGGDGAEAAGDSKGKGKDVAANTVNTASSTSATASSATTTPTPGSKPNSSAKEAKEDKKKSERGGKA